MSLLDFFIYDLIFNSSHFQQLEIIICVHKNWNQHMLNQSWIQAFPVKIELIISLQ